MADDVAKFAGFFGWDIVDQLNDNGNILTQPPFKTINDLLTGIRRKAIFRL